MLFNADFARACIEPTEVFSIENILETHARQDIIDGLMREIYKEARNKGYQINFDIGVGETADWVLAELSDYGYGVTSEEVYVDRKGLFKRVTVQW
jgi:hypothetical protein